ncbi:hypothetical protein LG634_36995 [Streptomyces bambusae]|uniref:hypothetical protein n=1 Tax=Streptomyces bambusae TaxID=1550616 RepID=UPI001CFFB788|nr:hypothetical protein [Streptomyces bambusae]MCB5170377.1 hypothetical protein [Streptomyces bambusae]
MSSRAEGPRRPDGQPRPERRIEGALTDQLAWDVLYQLALDIAERHGATVSAAARTVGPYGFVAAIEEMGTGLTLSWEGRLA